MHEDHFRHSSHPTIQRVWRERIEPYIQNEIYTVIECHILDFKSGNVYIISWSKTIFDLAFAFFRNQDARFLITLLKMTRMPDI